MTECEDIDIVYETESITWESEEESMPSEEVTEEEEKREESEEKGKAIEKEEACADSPPEHNLVLTQKQDEKEQKEQTMTLPRVKSVIIPGPRNRYPQYPVGIRAPYRHQIELRARNREMLLFESYSHECCVWQPTKGRLLLYIPRTVDHERSKNWYVYPALRIFPGRVKLNFNLELTPKVKPVFDNKSLMFAESLMHVKYRPNRRNGVRLTKGMLFGYLYINEVWEQFPSNMDMGASMYCPKCERVGHMATYCAKN